MYTQRLRTKTNLLKHSIISKNNTNLQKTKSPMNLNSINKNTKESTSSFTNYKTMTKTTENLSLLSNSLNLNPKYISTRTHNTISSDIGSSLPIQSTSTNESVVHFNIEYLHPFNRCSLVTKTLHIDTKRPSHNYTFTDRPDIMKYHKIYMTSLLSKSTNKDYKQYRYSNGNDLSEKVNKMVHKKDKIYEDELKDKLNSLQIENTSLYKLIKDCLINEFNPLETFSIKNDKFYEQKENKINFIEDILYYPYLQNKFQIRKCFDEAHELLALPNYLSKKNHVALNKERRKKMLVQEKNKNKVMLYARNDEMEQNKENNFYEKLHYEFKEYFMKRDLYKNVGICQNNKVRGLCFNQENWNKIEENNK